MKTLFTLFTCFILFTNAQAQKIYQIDSKGNFTESITADAQSSYVFKFDKALDKKKVEIVTGTLVANASYTELGKSFLTGTDPNYFIVEITNDRKIKGCGEGCRTITEEFTLKLEDKELGKFKLTPAANGGNKTVPANAGYLPGSIVNDALYISANIKDKANLVVIKEILETQYNLSSTAEVNSNHFLKGILDVDKAGSVEGGLTLKSIAGSVGGLDVTNIADGFAKFIVKRTKEELSIAFFQKFKNELDKYPDLKSVFPKTHGLLVIVDQEIYTYSNYVNILREAFRADIRVLDENLPSIIDNHEAFFTQDANYILKVSLLSGCYLSSSLKKDTHIGDVIQGFPLAVFANAPGTAKVKIDLLKGAIQTVQLFSESLKESDPAKNSYWVDATKLRELAGNPEAMKIYLGLVLEVAKNKYNNVPYSGSDNFYTLLNTATNAGNFSNEYPIYRQFLVSMGNKADELNKLVTALNNSIPDTLKAEHYAKYFKSSVQLLETATTEVAKLPVISKISKMDELAKDSKPYFAIANQVTDLVSSISRKKYPEAINNLVFLYNTVYVRPASPKALPASIELTKKEKLAIADGMVAAVKSNRKQEIGAVVAADPGISAVLKRIEDPASKDAARVLTLMTKYGAFMANMVQAENSDAVAAAIESAVLPAGSASIKRQTRFNVSLNAYCGLFAGNEIIKGLDSHKPFKEFNSFGLAVPIGIAFSQGDRLLPWPLSYLAAPKGWSSSVFISLVDLGAVAAYRFKDSETEQVPTIKLQDIFSPGIFWSVGIPKTPISVNFGTQFGPNLRKVNDTANDYSDKTYTRYSVSFCADVPLLNLFTNSRK